MKLFFKFFAIISVIAVSMNSCQKEISEDDFEPVDPPLTDSSYIHKIYWVDSIPGVIDRDTAEIITYFYDSQKRVVLITDSITDAGEWLLFKSHKYQYNGNDTLPYRYVYGDYEKVLDYGAIEALDSTITLYQYNAAGKNIYDSSIEVRTVGSSPWAYNTAKSIRRYQYAGNSIYSENVHTDNNSGDVFQQRDTALTDGNGNILSSKKYNVEAGVSTLEITSTFTYDNKRNPFALLSNFRTLRVLPLGETFTTDMQSTNNRLNALEISESNGFTFNENLTGKYTYNSRNLPVMIKDEYIPYPGEYYTFIFRYRSL